MEIKIFDPSDLDNAIEMSPEEIQDTICPMKLNHPYERFRSHVPYMQYMELREDGQMGSLNMGDASIDMNLSKTTDTMLEWMNNKLLIIAKTPNFELVSHGSMILKTINQIERIIDGSLRVSSGMYLGDQRAGYLPLNNHYFFSENPGHAEKFLQYLES